MSNSQNGLADNNQMRYEMKQPLVVIANYRICVMGDSFGVPPDQYEFLKGLATTLGHVSVAAPIFGVEQRGHRKVTSKDGVSLVRLAGWHDDLQAWKKLTKYLQLLVGLRSIICHNNFFYIFLPGWSGLFAGVLCEWRSVPYGCYVRGGLTREGRLATQVYRRLCRNARFIYCTGAYLTAQIRKLNSNVALVRPAIALDTRSSQPPAPRSCNGPASLLFVSRLEPAKGVEDFIELIRILNEQGYDVRGTIAGAGAERDEAAFRKLATVAGLSEKVVFAGYIADQPTLKSLYRDATLFVFPSRYNEGFPRVIYEAMLSGLPAVAYKCEFGQDLLVDGENCALVPAGSVTSLVDRVARLLGSADTRARIASKAYLDVVRCLGATGDRSHCDQVATKLLRGDGS